MIYDAVVVGAGPGGAFFSACAGKKGKKILLIDGQTEDNSKPCGGLLSEGAQRLFARLEMTVPSDILASPQVFGVTVTDLGNGLEKTYPKTYISVNRYLFDRWMLSNTGENVTVIKGRCTDIKKNGETFTATVKLENGTSETFEAKNIVGADGGNSLVRKLFYPKKQIKKYVAIQQWFDAGDIKPFYSCVFDKETSESCSWTFFKDGKLVYGGCFDKKNCREAFEKQKNKYFEFKGIKVSDPVKTEACLACSPRHFSDFVTGEKGVYLIGEAAGFISASSFEGISGAVKSGYILAEAFCEDDISKAYRKKTFSMRISYTLKIAKRVFTHTPLLRRAVMRTGVQTVKTIREKDK